MKSLEEHFANLINELQVSRLVMPKVKDKISELKRVSEKGKKLAREIENKFEAGLAAVVQLEYLNSTFPQDKLGDALIDESLKELRKHKLNITDLAEISDYAYNRVQAHTQNGTYQSQYHAEDSELRNLPARLAALSPEPGVAAKFLRYIQHTNLTIDWKNLDDKFSEFQEIVINGVLKAGYHYTSILDVRIYAKKSWEDIRKDSSQTQEDNEWITKFEELEKKYPHVNLAEVAKLYVQDEQ